MNDLVFHRENIVNFGSISILNSIGHFSLPCLSVCYKNSWSFKFASHIMGMDSAYILNKDSDLT